MLSPFFGVVAEIFNRGYSIKNENLNPNIRNEKETTLQNKKWERIQPSFSQSRQYHFNGLMKKSERLGMM